VSDGVPEGADGSLGSLAQERLEFREGLLDRIEVGAVGWQEAQLRAGRLDQGLDARALVAGMRGPKPGAKSPDASSDDLFHTLSP
jgi:hypothetical protein